MAKKNEARTAADAAGFEKLMAEAEELAARIESGELPLEESMAAYSRGVANLKACAEMLKGAEEKVKLLLEKDGVLGLGDMDVEGLEDGEDEE